MQFDIREITLFRINTPRDQGGLGAINIPLLSDITHDISKAYGVYLEDLGHTLRQVTTDWLSLGVW